MSTPRRLRQLPRVSSPLPPPLDGLDVRCARSALARLRGLAGLPTLAPGVALLLPRTRSIHTFGMRFPLDLVWLGRDGSVLRVDRGVPPCRVRACRRAVAVVELASPGACTPASPGARP